MGESMKKRCKWKGDGKDKNEEDGDRIGMGKDGDGIKMGKDGDGIKMGNEPTLPIPRNKDLGIWAEDINNEY